MFKPLLSTLTLLTSSAIAHADGVRMSFDVAEDHTRIYMAAQPMHDNNMPAHGNAFLSQGYIYPAGTLNGDTKGVNQDGSPAFPGLVLGTWTCDGYFVGEGSNATSGVWVISRQVFVFNDGDTVITQGPEIADIGKQNLRPVTGSTGEYEDIEGGLVQTTLGFNDFMAINATFAFETAPADQAAYTVDEDDFLEWDSGAPVGPIRDKSDSSM